MSRRETDKTIRVHLQLFEDDWDWISDHYKGTIGASKFVRSILRAYIRQLQAKAQAHANRPTVTGPIQGLDTAEQEDKSIS